VHIPRLPDWLVYATIVLAILFASLGRREKADAPAPPPPVPGADRMPIDPSSPFASARLIPVSDNVETGAGTAFSVGDNGVWMTARRVINGCRRTAIVVAPGRSVPANPRAGSGDIAVLTTQGGAPAMPLALAAAPSDGDLAFQPGFPHGEPGEAASRLLGAQTVRPAGRGQPREQQLAWAEVGRTDGLNDALSGLLGAPVLDGDGRVIGVTLSQAPRRGRFYTTTPDAMRQALTAAGLQPPPPNPGQAITADNYGRVADSLRLTLSVAQVVCLAN
jgi:serine protease Do